MRATGVQSILLATANPERGRIIRDGNYYVDGVPLHQTAFASDPEYPRATSAVRELLGQPGPPLGEWQSRYSAWLREPVSTQMYRARPLFDLRAMYGDATLWSSVEA